MSDENLPRRRSIPLIRELRQEYEANMKYFHEVPQSEIDELEEKGLLTVGYVMSNYKQPDWCQYPDALAGVMGCWSLMAKDTRSKISKDFCSNCDYFSPSKNVNSNKKKK
jgi:hypothetical protein